MAAIYYLESFFRTITLSSPWDCAYIDTSSNSRKYSWPPWVSVLHSQTIRSVTGCAWCQQRPSLKNPVCASKVSTASFPKDALDPVTTFQKVRGSHSADRGCSMPAECSAREWYGKHRHRLNLCRDSKVSAEPVRFSHHTGADGSARHTLWLLPFMSSIQGNLHLQSQCFQHSQYFFKLTCQSSGQN